jgi:hypothetical protein
MRKLREKRQTGVGQAAASDVDGDDAIGVGGIEFDLAVDLGEHGEGIGLGRRFLG